MIPKERESACMKDFTVILLAKLIYMYTLLPSYHGNYFITHQYSIILDVKSINDTCNLIKREVPTLLQFNN